MSIWLSILLLCIGTVMLYFGAEWLVKGGIHLARTFHLSPLAIGLTVVAFGTSLPELLVSLKAALTDSATIAIGNVIGSNVANVGLVMGLSAFIFPFVIDYRSVLNDIVFYLAISLVFVLMILDGEIHRWEGAILFSGVIIYTWRRIKYPSEVVPEATDKVQSMGMTILLLVAGITLLYIGSDLFVNGALSLARILGVSEMAIGMTVVAFGTSLPEMATSVVASFRREGAISIGNIIGSNIFNILSVLGLVSVLHPLHAPTEILSFEIPFMLAYGVVIIPLGMMKQPLPRTASAILLFGYILFVAMLFNG